MTISELTLKSRDEEPVRRLEIFTGAGRRREWPPEEKARIVAESYAADETVCAVARRHGLTPQQLFTWRRSVRKRVEAPPAFVPAVVVAPEPVETKDPKPRTKRRAPRRRAAAIELEASGVTVKIGDGTSPAMIAAVIRALKARRDRPDRRCARHGGDEAGRLPQGGRGPGRAGA